MNISFLTSQNSVLSYEAVMKECMKDTEVTEIHNMDGTKGYGYSFDLNCLKGAKLPKFNTITLEGKNITTDSLFGKINIINFWFKACKPCLAEIPGFNKIEDRFGPDEINYISISMDKEEDLNQFLKTREFNFTHLLNGKEIINRKFKHKGGYPATIITNRNLEIVEIIKSHKSETDKAKGIEKKIDHILRNLVK